MVILLALLALVAAAAAGGAYAYRRRRPRVLPHVRVHLAGDEPSVEGFLEGVGAGHYRLLVPKVLRGEGVAEPLDGVRLDVPIGKVVFVQVLTL